MKKLFGIMTAMLLILSVIPVMAVSTGTGIGLDITPEAFAPRIWMCDSRAVLEDSVEMGRSTISGISLDERINNYAFEGEQIQWDVLVMDKNKIEQIQEVVGTIGSSQGEGNDIEVECRKINPLDGDLAIPGDQIPDLCNARILEEDLTDTDFDPETQQYYTCTLTVETPDSMYGEYFITVEAIGSDGQSATMDENEYWFLNPTIALKVDGALSFDDVRPGSVSYSDTLLVGNDADEGSGVLMDMFISGTDFYDPSSSDAKCPTSNRLKLSDDVISGVNNDVASWGTQGQTCNADTTGLTTDIADHLCYYATNGAYGTQNDPRNDAEGYVPINYGNAFTTDFYNDAEIIADTSTGALTIGGIAGYYNGNTLTSGAEIALTFKLGLPEPCIGDFSSGQIYFWGEAI